MDNNLEGSDCSDKIEDIIRDRLGYESFQTVLSDINDVFINGYKWSAERYEDDTIRIKLAGSLMAIDIEPSEAKKIFASSEKIMDMLAFYLDGLTNFENPIDSIDELQDNMELVAIAAKLMHEIRKEFDETYYNNEYYHREPNEEEMEIQESLQDVIRQKIKDMSIPQFLILLKCFDGKNNMLKKGLGYGECIAGKVQDMTNEELVYFLNMDYEIENIDPEVQDAIREVVLDSQSSLVTCIWNEKISQSKRNKTVFDSNPGPFRIRTICALIKKAKKNVGYIHYGDIDSKEELQVQKQPEYKEYIKNLSRLNRTEFLVYMYKYFDSGNGLFEEEREVIKEQAKKMSDLDLTLLLDRFYSKYGDGDKIKTFPIRIEARERGLIDDESEKNRAWRRNSDIYKKLSMIDDESQQYINSADSRIRRSSRYEVETKSKNDLKTELQSLVKEIESIGHVERLAQFDCKTIVGSANSFYAEKYHNSDSEKIIEDFYKFAIYGLPEKYCFLFRDVKNYYIENAMKLKLEEHISTIEKFDNTNRTMTLGEIDNAVNAHNNSKAKAELQNSGKTITIDEK